MKKKSIIILAIVLSMILIIPFIGNKVVESVLKDRVEVLNSYGLEIENIKTDFVYLTTKRYYNMHVSDAEKFVAYLNQFSNIQIPPYVNAMLEGTKIGGEVQYYNIPLMDEVSVDIYPLQLSENIMSKIKDEDAGFAEYFSEFLLNKGFVYHLKYNILSEDFYGEIKDIKESYIFASGYTVDAKLRGMAFNGHGLLLAPELLTSTIEELSFIVDNNTEKFDFLLLGIKETLKFESKTSYSIASSAKRIRVNIDSQGNENSKIALDNVRFDFSSNDKNKKAEFFAKAMFDKLSAKTPMATIELNNFIYDTSLTKIDKDSFTKIIELINQAKINQTPQIQEQMKESVAVLLSKGLELKVIDLSIAKIVINQTEDLEGVSVKADITLLQNEVLADKQADPKKLINKMKIEILIIISKKMFTSVSQTQPALVISQGFAKEQNENLIFDIKIDDGKLTINDKAVQ